MGNKKFIVIFVLIIVIFVGWLLAFKSVTRVDDIKKQNELINRADSFMDRELYIRAIPLYEDAYKIKTSSKKNLELEEKLLKAYFLHGELDKYSELVEKRANDNSATVPEYKTIYEYYFNHHKADDAFNILKKGITNTGDQELKDLYEQYRYLYRRRPTKYSYIEITGDNKIMPVFDGEKWGYIGSNGSVVLTPQYDEVTDFTTGGIAAVKKDGKYYTITQTGDRYGADDKESVSRIQEVLFTYGKLIIAKRDDKYSIFDVDFNKVSDKYSFDEITRPSSGVVVGKNGSEWVIVEMEEGKQVLGGIEEVAINSYGSVFANNRAMVKINGRWHLIDTSGKDLTEQTFDGAKAPESEGYIAVENSSGRWGFINNKGEIVIDYQYLDAYSFSDLVAAVQKYNDSWIFISRFDVPISDEEFEGAKPFHGGIGQVYSQGNIELISYLYPANNK